MLSGVSALPDLGGLRRSVELAPGQSVEFELDLAAWADFAAPGRYQARVRYRLVAEPPDSFRVPAYAKAHQLWDAEVAAECSLTIE